MKSPNVYLFSVLLSCTLSIHTKAQEKKYTHADTLKGTYSRQRSWWDVLHYDLHVGFNIADSTVSGRNRISYKVLEPYGVLQLDLMEPMMIDSVLEGKSRCYWIKDGNSWFVSLHKEQMRGTVNSITVFFHGKPHAAVNPPWDGGVIWSKDTKGNPWISVACQGMAAQVWFPNKDHMLDEPDSCDLYVNCPKDLIAVSNGRLKSIDYNDKGPIYHWKTVNPINNYNIIPYIGKYVFLKDTLLGEEGKLDLDYWVLEGNDAKAKKQFEQVKPMIHCFEYWFGPYPFYADGYKLVEAPFLGMEHQSAIAYGNDYKQGYKGHDLSNTGWGMKWDFIIVHESGHEWFGNNISAQDVADNWIHESFTAYAENLYTEYLFGKKAGAEYVIGTRISISNDKPIIADYDVNAGGSIDIYYKGANMLHTIRQIVNNDSLWRAMLRGLNSTFKYQTVTSGFVEEYMKDILKIDLQKTFDQYLRTTQIPQLEYKIKKGKLSYRWVNCIKGFNMPVKIHDQNNTEFLLLATEKWQKIPYQGESVSIDKNFYVNSKKAG